MLILAGNLSTQVVIAIAPHTAIGQRLLQQLPALIPHQSLTTVIRVPNPHQLSVLVVAVVGDMAVGIGLTRNVALVITLVLPDRLTPAHHAYEAIVMLVGRRLVIPRKQRDQAPGFIVLIRRHRPNGSCSTVSRPLSS